VLQGAQQLCNKIFAEPMIKKMKNQKINYDRVLKKLINQWEREGVRPKISTM
jgi:hypothetical protein